MGQFGAFLAITGLMGQGKLLVQGKAVDAQGFKAGVHT